MLFAMAACLLAAGGTACHSVSHQPEVIAGVESPSARIAHLKKLAEEVKKMDPGQKGQVAMELTQQIQKEEDPLLRAEIIRTLTACGSPGADGVLRAALKDPEADVRTLACTLWGKRGDAEAVKLLADVLAGDEKDKDVRMAAARALGATHNPAAIAALGMALAEKDPAMQYCAVVSLRSVTDRDLGNDVDRWRAAIRDGSLQRADSPTLAERLRRGTF
ncbi:MAG: HEAT repeat domain-containing protein [Thermoguttaceae bacterium]